MASSLFQELSELSQMTDSNAAKAKLVAEMATENLSMTKRLKANHDALLMALKGLLYALDYLTTLEDAELGLPAVTEAMCVGYTAVTRAEAE